MLTVIVPAYNEEPLVGKTAKTISTLLEAEKIDYEIIFVNDGSTDRTWEEIEKAREANERIHGVCFSRNFGKEAAIYAGLSEMRGNCCVVIDCDLQHPPEKILEMYALWKNEGYEVVAGVKENRGHESARHRLAAKTFYRLIGRVSKIDMENASDFKLMDRKAAEAILECKEQNAFFRALSAWVGFKTATVSYAVRDREAGESKWSTKSLVRYAVSNIASFTTMPLQFVTLLGVITFIISVVFGIITLVQKICGRAIQGFTTVILLVGFIGSVIMFSLGIIGYYLARIYEEVKKRPKYIVTKKI